MKRSEAREMILHAADRLLERDRQSRNKRSGNIGYVCPICGSGSGKNGTGIASRDGVHFTCFARKCFTHEDLFGIIGKQYGLTSYNDQLQKAADLIGITIDDGGEPGKNGGGQCVNQKAAKDYSKFFSACVQMRCDTDYMARRGISDAVLDAFGVGYCPTWQSPTAIANGKNPPKTARIIFPTGIDSYVALNTRPKDQMTDTEKKFRRMKEGESRLFNIGALKSDNPVLVVEGETDLLSVAEVGWKSVVALGGTGNFNKLLQAVEASPPKRPLILSLDNDDAGRDTTDKIAAGLQRIGVSFYCYNISGRYKDPNDALVADRDAFSAAVQAAIEAEAKTEEEERQEYIETNSATTCLMKFLDGISADVDTPYTPTGFDDLDRCLDGGLYEGLYIIGAISSLGKTSLILQCADQIAKGGRDVLIFSLEMAKTELIARSVSRLTAQLSKDRWQSFALAKNTRGITVHRFWETYSEEEKNLITDAVGAYGEYADHIYIMEGVGDIGVTEIRQAVSKHISLTGIRPVVVVDYVQIVAPYIDPERPNRVLTDKQSIDKSVLELKRISRDFKLPVICISSFNRQSYKDEVSMAAFKESGALEYGADVLLGMQLEGVGREDFDEEEAKRQQPRKIELKILKNRNGETGGIVRFDYWTAYNLFGTRNDALGFTDTLTPSGAAGKSKPKKRDALRASLEKVFEETAINGESSLDDIATALNLRTKKQALNLLKDLGGYEIDGETVRVDGAEAFFREDA